MNKRKYKVIFIDYSWKSLDVERREFARIGAEVILVSSTACKSLLSEIRDADIIVNNLMLITKEVLDSLPHCQGVIRSGIGVDMIDVNSATRRGIIVANILGHCTDEVSDHALALLLCCGRKLVQGNSQVKQGGWSWKDFVPIHRLRDATLGVIGFGRIGQSVVQKAKAFGMRCLIYDPLVRKDIVSHAGGRSVMLEELCVKSDFISIHCPLTDDTEHLIGEKELRLMKQRAYIINTARGAVIDEQALLKALKAKWIAGAALDILEKEPPDPDNRLLQLDNVVLTSHYAFYSEESVRQIRDGVCDAGIRILKNRWPKWVVNPQLRSSWRHKDRID